MSELKLLCRDQQEIVTRLQVRGVYTLEDLGELSERDVKQLALKDIVVRRRMLKHIQAYPKPPLSNMTTLVELCCSHQRTLTQLAQHGVASLDDLKELEPEDIYDLELMNIVLVRRLVRYLAKEERSSSDEEPKQVRHSRSQSSVRITMSDTDARVTSPPRRVTSPSRKGTLKRK